MRADLPAPSSATLRVRDVSVYAFPLTKTPAQLISDPLTGGTNVSGRTGAIQQTDTGATVVLEDPDFVPLPGACLSIRDGSSIVFNGVVESARPSQQIGADKSVSLTVRRRDGNPYWRKVRRIGAAQHAGSDLGTLVRNAVSLVGVTPAEYDLPDVGVVIAQDTVQMSDMTPWDMLEQALVPARRIPLVDALGRVKTASREIRRTSTLRLSEDTETKISELATKPPLTAVRLKYIDPELAQSFQDYRVLASQTISVGSFDGDSSVDIWWSTDRKLRAIASGKQNGLVARKLNDALFVDPDASFEQTSPFGGRLTIKTDRAASIAGLGAGVGEIIAGAALSGANPVLGGAAIVSGATLLGQWQQANTTTYEIWGTPYDYVRRVQTVECYDQNAPERLTQIEDISSDLIPNEDVAIAVASAELLYRAKAASPVELIMADDYRVEPGDILELPDRRRLYVTGYSRDLTHDAEALVTLQGFWV